jgi:hypothetical protein
MPTQTYTAFLRAEREKLRKAASERMRQGWAAKPKIETQPQPKKTAKTASDSHARPFTAVAQTTHADRAHGAVEEVVLLWERFQQFHGGHYFFQRCFQPWR